MNIAHLGPVGGAYYLDNSRVAVIEGPVGSGKSTDSCLRLGRHAYEQVPSPDGVSQTRFAIVRNTKRQLEDTTLPTWKQVFPENRYGDVVKMGQRWQFKPKGCAWPVDAEFIFRALDDPDDVANLLSLEVTGFWLNECREQDEEIIGHLAGRTRFLNGIRPSTWSGWIGDTNPWHTEHWLEDRLVTNPREGWRHFRQPGAFDPQAENLENLNQTAETLALPFDDPRRRERGLIYYRNLLEDMSTDEARVYVHAERGIIRTGKPIYTEFNDRTHCRLFDPWSKVPWRIGMDFGRTPAAVIGQRDAQGRWRIRYELCAFGMGVKLFAEQLKRFLADKLPPNYEIAQFTGDPSGDTMDDQEETAFTLLKAAGFDMAQPASTNEPSLRVGAVQSSFKSMIEGQPTVLIHPECKMLRRGCIDGYHYRKLQVAGNRYDEKPNKNEWSHVCEALQYLFLGAGEGKELVRRHDAPARRPRRVLTEYSELG